MPNRTFYGLWDCEFCNKNGNINTMLFCPSCGAPMPMDLDGTPHTHPPADRNAFLITNQEYLDRIAKHLGVWQCGSCQGINLEEANFCTQCGRGKNGDDPNSVAETEHHTAEVLQWHLPTAYQPRVYDPVPLSTYSMRSTSPAHLASPGISKAILGFLVIAALVGLVVWATRTTTVMTTVQGFSWTRVITLERYAWVDRTSRSGFPADSRNQWHKQEVVGSHPEQRGTKTEFYSESVPDGETCSSVTSKNPDGSFTERESCFPKSRLETKSRQVPNMVPVDDSAEVYHFQIREWTHSRDVTSSGYDRNPYWPEYVLDTGEEPEREPQSARSEVYTVVFTDEKQQNYSQTIGFDQWTGWDAAAKYQVTVNNIGMVTEVKKEGVK